MSAYHKGKVSILIPCYNGLKYIEQCFDSILNQTYTNIDIIFVDDGSTDNSFARAETYKKRFSEKGMNLKCFYKENGGASSAIQLALQKVDSEFFELLDIDDWIYPDNIRIKVEYLINHPSCNFVRNDGDIFNVVEKRIVSSFSTRDEERVTKNIFYDLLFGKTYNWAGTYLIRSEAFFKINKGRNIYISRYGQNLQILLPLAEINECGFVPDKLTRYNEYPNSVSHNNSYEYNLKLLGGYEDIRIKVLKQMGRADHKLIKKINQFYALEQMKLATRYSKKIDVLKSFPKVSKTPKNILLFLCGINNVFSTLYLSVAKTVKGIK